MKIPKLFTVAVLVTIVAAACAGPVAQSPAGSTAVAGLQTTPSASPAVMMATVKTATDANLGTILVDADGMTLYRFAKDQGNVSACYDQCAQNWPPLVVSSGEPVLAAGVPGMLATTERTDGSRQVTYNGMPLYYYVKDMDPGDTTGQNVGGIWFVVQPSALP